MIIDSPIISGSYLSTGSLSQTGNVSITGSLTVTDGITGSIQNAVSASYALTASYLTGYVSPFPFTGSAEITGSLGVTGSFSVNGSEGTVFSSNADILLISGSLVVTGSTIITGSLSVSGSITGSLFGTSSQAVSASYANFALTSSYSLAGSGFPYSGSAVITGSLVITNLETGSGVRYLVADASGLIQAQTASAAIFTTQQTIATAGQTVFPITNGYSTGYVTVFVNGTKLNEDEFTDTSGTNIVLATGSMDLDVVEFQKYLPASGVSNNTLRTQNYFVATEGQTTFNVNYTPGLVDLFYNGSKLENTEYTAANGTSITLATASAVGDKLEVDVYSYQIGAFSGIGGSGAANQIAYYSTTNSITGSNNFTVSGSSIIVTGSLIVSGSGTFTNIGPAVFSGSITSTQGMTANGDLQVNGFEIQLTSDDSAYLIMEAYKNDPLVANRASSEKYIDGYVTYDKVYFDSSTFGITAYKESNDNSANTRGIVEMILPTVSQNSGSFSIHNYYNQSTNTLFKVKSNGAALINNATDNGVNTLQVSGSVYANNFTGSLFGTASNAISSSYSATASFSNDFTVLGNLTVFGTQSVQYITSSQLNISDNVITVNVASPGVRFGGLSVFDSGSQSSEATASLFWDSQNNHWIYQRESGSTYDGGMIMSGPRNSAGLGNEQGTTACMLLVGQGGDHLTSSLVYHDSTRTCFYGTSLFISSSGNIGLGLNNPTNKLEVQSGNLKLNAGASRCTSVSFGITGTDYGKLEYSDMDGSLFLTTLGASSGYDLRLGTRCNTRLTIFGSGDACFSCGLTAKTIGTNDLILSNVNYECANYVDGTRGSWLIQEGACDLFIINQISCKKYKFNLIEIK